MSIQYITNISNFINSANKAIVCFSASWCGPCRSLKPVMEMVAGTRDDVSIAYVDIDSEKDLVSSYGVKSVPTVIGFVNGVEKDRFVGSKPKSNVNNFIDGLEV